MKTYRFKIFGHDYETKVVRRDNEEVVFTVNGIEYKAYLQQSKKVRYIKPTPKVNRPPAAPEPGTPITDTPLGVKGAGAVKAPLPGLIIKVNVKVGDQVKVGQPVVVLEAMKMESPIQATIDGAITAVSVREGETVLEGQDLVIIG